MGTSIGNKGMGARSAAGVAAMIALAGAGAMLSTPGTVAATATSQADSLPPTITLTGTIRDFKDKYVSGGHPNFEQQPTRNFGQYAYICADTLDADGKPVFSSTGKKVIYQWKDAEGRQIAPHRAHFGQRAGTTGQVETVAGGAATNATDFAQWFRDVPNVNLSKPLSLTLTRQAGSKTYTFNDTTDPFYRARGGFFPINGELWGNSGGSTPNTNFHFTFELDTTFVYKRGTGQVFTFVGDDDVFVFIDGKCVIDIGGVHGAVSQTINLDTLPFLQDGKRYPLKFFFAERHRTQSNFRIETTIELENAKLPQSSSLFD